MNWKRALPAGLIALGALAALAGGGASLRADDAGDLRLRAGTIHTGDGPPIRGGEVVIRHGKVVAVRAAAATGGAGIEDLGSHAVIVPGLVDLRSSLGAQRDLSDPTFPVQGDAAAEDVFAPLHRDFARALEAGVTTVVLLPHDDNLVGGLGAAVKTAPGPLASRLVRTDGPLALSLGAAVRRRDRVPTSRMGVYDLLGRTLDEAARLGGELPLARFARGRLEGIVHASDTTDVRHALAAISARGLRAAIHADIPWAEALEDLRANPVPVILGPFGLETPERILRAPGLLAREKIEVALAGGSPGAPPDGLRITAALAVRHGLPASLALAAITSLPARLAGIEDRVGSLAPGRDADLVVLSGDPLDLSARLLAVYVGGREVYRADPEQRSSRP